MNKTIAKENVLKRNEFVSKQEIKTIKVEDIILTEPIHINAKVNFTKQVERLQKKNITIMNSLIIVRLLEDNKYTLVSGYNGYSMAKLLNHEYIPAIIVQESRKGFIKKVGFKSPQLIEGADNFMDTDKILIPKLFLEKNVGREKVDSIINYYKKHKSFDKPVVIKGKRLCIDGYARLFVAKMLNLKRVPVRFA